MVLPLLIVPAGGVKVVSRPKLALHLFATYESAWALAAKLAAANALSACEVSALLGISATNQYPLLPDKIPRVARALGSTLGFPPARIQGAFLGGALKCLHPLMDDRLRLCPTCSRQGHHFIVHQLRPFANCPLHGLPLRDRCRRCGGPLAYGLGSSIVFGPINCPTCRAPQLPLSVGGHPMASVMSARSLEQIARWLAFLRRRINLAVLYEVDGGIDTGRFDGSVPSAPMRSLMPSRSASGWLWPKARGRWFSSMQTRCLEMCFWTQANRLWKQCHGHSRRWYVSVIRGHAVEVAPNPQVLAFLYWRMTWQGCSNPYLLRRSHGLPLYGIAEWEASQCAHDDDDIDITMSTFNDALAASWKDWLDCIDLFRTSELEGHTWRFRALPSTFL